MRKRIALFTSMALMAMALPAFAETALQPAPAQTPASDKVRVDYIVYTDEEDYVHDYIYYVVSYSPQTNMYWATSMDGKKNLWFHASEITSGPLSANDNFKATFNKDGQLLSLEKYVFE